jgi:hypothetical protein
LSGDISAKLVTQANLPAIALPRLNRSDWLLGAEVGIAQTRAKNFRLTTKHRGQAEETGPPKSTGNPLNPNDLLSYRLPPLN